MASSSACSASWSREENKAFENALAIYGDVDQWDKIAAVIPGKTLEEVKQHYNALRDDVMAIEAGCVPLPDYGSPSQKFSHDAGAVFDRPGGEQTKKANHSSSSKTKKKRPLVERKRGKPWTEEEHRLFLLGLEKFGKGDWRSISRQFVLSKTPTQVASHAQKYYQRIRAGGSRRVSIHDVTVAHGSTSAVETPLEELKSEAAQLELVDHYESQILSGNTGLSVGSSVALKLPNQSGVAQLEPVDNYESQILSGNTSLSGGSSTASNLPYQGSEAVQLEPTDNNESRVLSGDTDLSVGSPSALNLPNQRREASQLEPVDNYGSLVLFGDIGLSVGSPRALKLPNQRHVANVETAHSLFASQGPIIPALNTGFDNTSIQSAAHAHTAGVGHVNFGSDIFLMMAYPSHPIGATSLMPGNYNHSQMSSGAVGPYPAQSVGAASVGPGNYNHSQMLSDAVGCTDGFLEIPMPLIGEASVGPGNYRRIQMPFGTFGCNVEFLAMSMPPNHWPTGSTVETPVITPQPTLMLPGVTQTPYGLFIPNPPVLEPPSTNQSPLPSDPNPSSFFLQCRSDLEN